MPVGAEPGGERGQARQQLFGVLAEIVRRFRIFDRSFKRAADLFVVGLGFGGFLSRILHRAFSLPRSGTFFSPARVSRSAANSAFTSTRSAGGSAICFICVETML
jgi:hypothetical protein